VQDTHYIQRKLTVEDRSICESEALQDERHLVVLAEPGAGKTELLKNFARILGVTRQRASTFRLQSTTQCGETLVVDGFDEVAKLDQSAFDSLIGKIANVGPKRVIIASRSSEWDSARYDRLISDTLGSKPLLVRLKAFEEPEQKQLYEGLYPLRHFSEFQSAASEFGLHVLLGNPQMLEIIALAYEANDGGFRSKGQVFSDAFAEMCREHNPDIPAKDRLSSAKISALGSEIFAKLLLAGATGVKDTELSSDRNFPFLGDLTEVTSSSSRQVIDTKLFKPSDEAGSHEPVHRIVAEFGAARYLAKRVNTETDELTLSRVLSVIAPSGALRDDLRGLLAWLTTEVGRHTQRPCIDINPYAVLSNGDPSQLPDASKIYLIEQLLKLSASDPYFRRADRWRNFNTKGFFTVGVVEAVRRILDRTDGKTDLRDLLLELVEKSGEESALEPELARILHSKEADFSARLRAMNCLFGIAERDKSEDVTRLIDEGSHDALRLAAEIFLSDLSTQSRDLLLAMFRACIPLYKDDDLALDQPAGSTYFISSLISELSNRHVTFLLTELTKGLRCTCGKKSYECRCRVGISKIVGKLLDRYFDTALGPHSPIQLWQWIEALNFRNAKSDRESQSVKALQDDHALRRAIQLLSFERVIAEEEYWEEFVRFRHGEMHSGLFLTGEDETWMLEYAAQSGRTAMFAAFYRTHNWHTEYVSPSVHRVTQRALSRSAPELLSIAALKERRSRRGRIEFRERRYRYQSKHRKRRDRIDRANAAHFEQHRGQIEKGRNWHWLRRFAREYLQEKYDPDGVIKFAGDASLVENSLRSSIPFLAENAPTLDDVGKARAEGKGYHLPEVAYAAILANFRERGSLDDVPRSLIALAKTDINVHHSGLSDDERKAFHAEIDRRLFPTERELIDYLKRYVEPQLRSDTVSHTSASILCYDKAFAGIAEETALRWLAEFPHMPLSSADILVDVASRSKRYGELCAIISKQCEEVHRSWPYGPPEKLQMERRDFWFLRSFAFCDADDEWPTLKQFANNIFAFSNRYDSLAGSRDGVWPTLTARKIFLLLDAFVDKWPPVPLPSSWGTGSPRGETAYRFLNSLIWRISDDDPANQIEYLEKLLADPRFEEWHDGCRHFLTEAKRKNLLRNFSAPSPGAVCGLLDSSRVSTVEDLRALVVEELRAAERWFRESETDPIDAFYAGGKRVSENTARNRIVERLDPKLQSFDVIVSIESAMARQNRCDFTAVSSIEGRRTCLVVEVKGQWHRELFTAASAQLFERYSHHPDAAGQGIYLALWFGPHEKIAGRAKSDICTAAQLEEAIRAELPASLLGAIDIVVLDLSR
tara:strand:- start:2629 stop:6639 length:4011 start_codon:yes stop_codon:yes gene_type:complete